jgi:hypothetical protein
VTAQSTIQPHARSGKWPVYGFGSGPAYLSGQTDWFAGGQAAVLLIEPSYPGPLLVRSGRLDGGGSLVFTGLGASGASVSLPATAPSPYWRTWDGTLAATDAGCYGIQVDGPPTEIIVLEVKAGQAAPG